MSKLQCCPKEWREIEEVTGDYDFDASLHMSRQKNSDLDKKINMYTLHGNSYGIRTGYNGYSGYSGDE